MDIDEKVPGVVARRVLLTGGRVLAVRRDDLPERTPLAAILRYGL